MQVDPLPSTTAWMASWHWPDTAIYVVVAIVLAIIVRWVVNRLIDQAVRNAQRSAERRGTTLTTRAENVLARATGYDYARHVQRTATLGSLLRSISTVVIFTIALLYVMDALGLNLAPVLASAGVGGVALGFGAQSVVKDFLSGVFMIMEDQYGVGDIIDTGEVTGTVEEVTLRVTRLRDGDGVVWHIRNGEIQRIANRSQGWSTATVDVPVDYDEPPEAVISALTPAMAALDDEEPWQSLLLEEPKVLGVESITGGAITIRIVAKCAPNEHWGVQREIRERAKLALDAAGIRGPAPSPPGP